MITKIEALSFLKGHQPMPSDKELKKEELETYEKVRDFFMNNFDEQCIRLFLNSFGGKDGFGIYQMVEDVIMMYNKETVLPYILNAFNNPSDCVKYWCIQISFNFPDGRLFVPLIQLLQSEDEDIKLVTITALAQLALNGISVKEVIKVMKDEIDKTADEEMKQFITEVLSDIESSN